MTEHGVLYGAGTPPARGIPSVPGVASLSRLPIPDVPGLFLVTPIGEFGVNIPVIEYVPGLGLLGMTDTAIYNIDTVTGGASLRTVISWPATAGGRPPQVGDFAWDDVTGALVATFVTQRLSQDETLPSWIFGIDQDLGFAWVLNDNAPAGLLGVARVDTPEPGPGWPVGVALGLAACAKCRQRRATPVWCL